MYIRDDLLNKIKEIFEIKELTYIRSEKYLLSSNYPFLLCSTDKNLIAIRRSDTNEKAYYLEVVEKSKYFNYYYVSNYLSCILEIRENETVLTKISLAFDTEEYRFPGEAFDFNKEFVITVLENMNGGRVINNVYKRRSFKQN